MFTYKIPRGSQILVKSEHLKFVDYGQNQFWLNIFR